MMTTAVVALADGIEAPNEFPLRLVRCLTLAGHRCTLIWVFRDYAPATSQPFIPGVEIIYLRHFRGAISRLPESRIGRLAEQLAPMLRRFDVVYSFLPWHLAMHAIRERRFSRSRLPVFVTIASYVPANPSEIGSDISKTKAKDFGERYQVGYSDYFVCLGSLPKAFETRNWALPTSQHVRWIGHGDAKWLKLHGEVVDAALKYRAMPKSLRNTDSPTVTVWIRHSNGLESLEVTLDSLSHQNSKDFALWVVGHGVNSAAAAERYNRIEEHYCAHGWRFILCGNGCSAPIEDLAPNAFESKYLLFLDAGNIASPRLINRMLEGIRLSDDDLLTTWSCRIPNGRPDDFEDRMGGMPEVLYKPIGDYSDGPLGPPCLLVKTEVLQAVGGFPNCLDAGYDHKVMLHRVRDAGYRTDIIPELLIVHRDSGLKAEEPSNNGV
jgi:hypothetical protein